MPRHQPIHPIPSLGRWLRRGLLGAVLAGLMAIAGAALRDAHDTDGTSSAVEHNLDHARQVLARHRGELVLTYGAVGAGVRRRSLEDPTPVVVVYLPASPRHQPPTDLRLDAVPVIFEITGRTALSTRAGAELAAPPTVKRRGNS